MATPLKPGFYGQIEILSRDPDCHYARWNCRCRKCGYEFSATANRIREYQDTGCVKCRQKAAKEEHDAKIIEEYVGKRYGDLEILEYVGTRKFSKRGSMESAVKVRCHKCGGLSIMPLSRIKDKGAAMCGDCVKKYLEGGRKYVRETTVAGTLPSAIDGRRAVNKNSSTGYNGVSFNKRMGKYRAYINFQRKQYNLGQYDDIEDAIKARKEAEKNIYGDFLAWYAEEYPDKWELLQESGKNKKAGG